LRSLTALGFVRQEETPPARFSLEETGRLANQPGGDGLLNLAHKEAFFYQLWTHLDDVVRTGKARLPPFSERVHTDPAFIQVFLLALNDLAAKGSAGFLKCARLDGLQRLLDLGGGAAGYACILAQQYPALSITLVDLPEILPLAHRVIAERNLTDRIEVVAGDIFQANLGITASAFDAVLVSHILHDFSEPSCREILRHAGLAVKSGGRIIVNDVFTDTGALKLPETFFDLMMQVENPGGCSHSLPAVQDWMREAGWTDLHYDALYFGGMIQGHRAA